MRVKPHASPIGKNLPTRTRSRRVRAQELAGAGEHTVPLESLDLLAPGIYHLRLTQGGVSRSARVAILR